MKYMILITLLVLFVGCCGAQPNTNNDVVIDPSTDGLVTIHGGSPVPDISNPLSYQSK